MAETGKNDAPTAPMPSPKNVAAFRDAMMSGFGTAVPGLPKGASAHDAVMPADAFAVKAGGR